MLNNESISFINSKWDNSIIAELKEYIKIPNKSPIFDKDWQQNGYMSKAVQLMLGWCQNQDIKGMRLEVIELENRTPLIFIEVDGASDETILLYGHLDKQPEMSGWAPDLGPWLPVLKDDKLYGRGGADDGYAIYSSLTAIEALQKQNIPHARCVIIIEACEESGSYDLPFYIDFLAERIGKPDLVICLDSGCGNYDQLWMTTSLRGLVGGTLSIEVLSEGVHSGLASGIVPSCFLVLRQLLDRIENVSNGKILLSDLDVSIPEARKQQAIDAAKVLNNEVYASFPFIDNVQSVTNDNAQLLLNSTWLPALSITGCDGLPELANAGNVTLPKLTFKLSMRLPPTCDINLAAKTLKDALEHSPPFNAKIKFAVEDQGRGWNAPRETTWLTQACHEASNKYFGKEAVYMGLGGTIPFMGMLGEKFPAAQFLITGVLGPKSNAHGPNEFLHIPTAKKLTGCVADIIARHFVRVRE